MDRRLDIREAAPEPGVVAELLALSALWEAEGCCYGYRKNSSADLDGRRIFTAVRSGRIVGYLLGKLEESSNMRAIMPEKTNCFEIEELYVHPDCRGEGVGAALFLFAQEHVRREADYLTLSAVAKHSRPLLRFYMDELGMELWSARLFKRL